MGRMYQKLALCGGEGGREWDDDVYEGVKKVYVGQDLSRITYVKFEYVKEGGEVVTREYGTITQDPREFIIEYPDEHIIAVEGSYNKVALIATEVITSLVFKTSKGRTSPTFGPNLFGVVSGTKFKFEDEGKKIVGFHGRSDNAIDALGVYLVLDSLTTPFPLYKLDAQGGTEGRVWDDGSFDGVRTLRVCQDDHRITYLEFEYDKSGKSEKFHHGVKGGTPSEDLKMARMYKKLAICGGEGGHEWDDDVYEGVRKVYVGQDLSRITYIKFEYVKVDGAVITREYGTIHQQPKEFELYPNEHIKTVEGSYNVVALCATEVITSLIFKTSRGRTSPTFGPNLFGLVNGTKFVLEDTQGKKIVGFHGRSDNALDALGVYFALDSLTTSTPLYKLEAQGGTEGRVWDDGSYDAVKTMRIGQDNSRITYFECEYVKGEKSETRHHGMKGEAQFEIVLVPGEYIKSVEATYHKTSLFRNTVITSLKLETSAGRTSFFGYKTGKKFVLKQKDRRLVGFHGREGDAIDALGAYFAPIPTPVPVIPATKLPSVGGNGGVAWDDGVYDGVRKIYIGQGNDGVSFVKFEYVKGKNLVSGDDHGKKTILGAEEFVLEDGEYLTALEGYYDKIFGVEEPVIISLQFKTNKRESIQFGMDAGEKFSLGEKGHKIVGFHGQASDVLHSVGVTVVPITTTK